MADWIAVPVDYEGDVKLNMWLDLWEFNRGCPPKFWFGDKVKYPFRQEHSSDIEGIIVGLEWGQRESWLYKVRYDLREKLFTEDELEKLKTPNS